MAVVQLKVASGHVFLVEFRRYGNSLSLQERLRFRDKSCSIKFQTLLEDVML